MEKLAQYAKTTLPIALMLFYATILSTEESENVQLIPFVS
jgi:hypothetical protein